MYEGTRRYEYMVVLILRVLSLSRCNDKLYIYMKGDNAKMTAMSKVDAGKRRCWSYVSGSRNRHERMMTCRNHHERRKVASNQYDLSGLCSYMTSHMTSTICRYSAYLGESYGAPPLHIYMRQRAITFTYIRCMYLAKCSRAQTLYLRPE